MRLSIIIPALFTALAAATPAPASDSPELVKRYCGNNPPPHPACPKGLFQVSRNQSYREALCSSLTTLLRGTVLWAMSRMRITVQHRGD